MKATIVICTQNRPESLERAVASAVREAARAPWLKILVVDNGGGGGSAQAVKAARGGGVRLVMEPAPGLSNARNRAVKETDGGWIIFIDDDAELAPGYGEALGRFLREEGGRAGAFGGPVWVGWEKTPPPWWEKGLDPWCNALDLGGKRRAIRFPETPYGTNMGFDAALLKSLGGFRNDLGRNGAGLLDAEETELFIRMEKAGAPPVVYDPALKVTHYMTAERLSPEFLVKKAFWHGKSLAALERVHPDKIGGLKNAVFVLASSFLRGLCLKSRGPLTERVLRASAAGYFKARFLRPIS